VKLKKLKTIRKEPPRKRGVTDGPGTGLKTGEAWGPRGVGGREAVEGPKMTSRRKKWGEEADKGLEVGNSLHQESRRAHPPPTHTHLGISVPKEWRSNVVGNGKREVTPVRVASRRGR